MGLSTGASPSSRWPVRSSANSSASRPHNLCGSAWSMPACRAQCVCTITAAARFAGKRCRRSQVTGYRGAASRRGVCGVLSARAPTSNPRANARPCQVSALFT
jgi:hypothetical protein